MKKVLLLFFVFLFANLAWSQTSLISNNKPLAFFNPALQNTEMDKFVFSGSYLINPLIKEKQPDNFQAIAEYKVNDKLRIGIHGSKIENRLNRSETYKAYA